MNDALRRANEDLSQFAYIAAHDLQEPLRTVISFSQLVQRSAHGKLDADLTTKLNYVIWGAKRISQLVSDVVTYTNVLRTELDVRRVDLNIVLESALSRRHEDIQRLQQRVTHDRLPAIEGDANLLARVFAHLLGNASKFRREDVDLRVHVSAVQRDGDWIVAIEDNGQGFRQEYADRIFGIFKRLHGRDQYEGSGIGLAICQKIVERYGGTIAVQSAVGMGATFVFTLPAGTARAGAEWHKAQPAG